MKVGDLVIFQEECAIGQDDVYHGHTGIIVKTRYDMFPARFTVTWPHREWKVTICGEDMLEKVS